jgi:hypothetical protein
MSESRAAAFEIGALDRVGDQSLRARQGVPGGVQLFGSWDESAGSAWGDGRAVSGHR